MTNPESRTQSTAAELGTSRAAPSPAGIAFNLINMAIVPWLVLRQADPAPVSA